MKKHLGTVLLSVVMACMLGTGVVWATAYDWSPDAIWQIGEFDDDWAEFGTNFAGVDSTIFDVDTGSASDFPSSLYIAGYNTTPCVNEGVHEVVINFSLKQSWGDVQFHYARMGSGVDEVRVDGRPAYILDGPGEGKVTTHSISLGLMVAGPHSIVITSVVDPNGDGCHYIDALKLTGDGRSFTLQLS